MLQGAEGAQIKGRGDESGAEVRKAYFFPTSLRRFIAHRGRKKMPRAFVMDELDGSERIALGS